MGKVVSVKDFELHKVKFNAKKGLDIEFFDKSQPNELWSVSSDGQPNQDYLDGINSLKEVFAYSLGLSGGWDFAREHNRKDHELLKKAQLFWKQEIDRCIVNGITVIGSDENDDKGIKIAGSLKTDLGVVGLPSPIVRWDDSFNNSVDEIVMIGDLAEIAFKKIQEQVWLFIFKGKRGGELPFPDAEKPISGLNITKLEKVG
jgi:hypothetical protein